MHLRYRRRRDRRAVEAGKQNVGMPAERAFDLAHGEFAIERRYLVLQTREFVGDIGRQQITSRAQYLAELDEDRP